MPLDSVTHLTPRMPPVAVGTQEAKVAFVCVPIPKPARQVTSVTAKLPVSLFDTVGANIKRFSAMTADAFNLSILSHNITSRAVVMLSLYPGILRDCRTAYSPACAGT